MNLTLSLSHPSFLIERAKVGEFGCFEGGRLIIESVFKNKKARPLPAGLQ